MMSPERFQELLDTYGGREEHWPDEQRKAMHSCVEGHPELGLQLREAQELDRMLDSYVPATTDLQQRVIAALPIPFADRILAWLVPQAPQLWWRPVMAASLPLAMGLAIGMGSPGIALTDWESQERSLLMPATAEVWYE
ncbi:hypothetical protein [Congregibacter sp.]|uniref:hypothetical protein n=1 Tax=Congregibacter sp. TaxID=2744308 RepID=UPI00385C03CA